MANDSADSSLLNRLFFRLLPVQVLIVAMGSVNSIVDGVTAARFINSAAVGVIGLHYTVVRVMEAVSAVLLGGSAVLCGRYLGSGRIDKTCNVFSLNITLTLMVGAVLTAVSLIAPYWLAGVLGADDSLRNELSRYIAGYAFGILPQLLAAQLSAFLQLERQRTRCYIGVGSMIVTNAVLDVVLVGVLHMGVFGLGLATSIGNGVYFLIVLQYYVFGKSQLKYRPFARYWGELKAMLSIGFPGAVLVFCLAARNLVINHLLLTTAGNDGLSAMSSFNLICGLLIAVPIASGYVVRMLTSVFVGEEDRQSILFLFSVIFRKVLPMMVLAGAAVLICAPILSGLFFPDHSSNVYELARSLFALYSICIPMVLLCQVFTNYFQSIGRIRFVNVLSVFDGFISMVIPALIAAPLMGAKGVWISIPIGIAGTALLSPLYSIFCRKHWPHGVSEWLLLDQVFPAENEGERYTVSLHEKKEVSEVAEKIQSFCLRCGVETRQASHCGLCFEEMAWNIFQHGFPSDHKKHSVDLSMVIKKNDVLLRIKDDCIPFDCVEFVHMTEENSRFRNIGIRLAYSLATEISYQNLMGLNVLTIRLARSGKTEKAQQDGERAAGRRKRSRTEKAQQDGESVAGPGENRSKEIDRKKQEEDRKASPAGHQQKDIRANEEGNDPGREDTLMEKIRKPIHRYWITAAVLTLLLTAVCSFASHAAAYNYPYPTAQNKKGLALGADMEEDALELNISHATLNLPISWVIAHRWERNSYRSYSYEYKGKTYWFRRESVNVWDRILKKLKSGNVIVTGILLMEKRSDLKNLIYPKARNKKAAYYAWNMDGGKNQRQIEAAVSFLAERYSSGKHGRIVGWIVGNEIDSASEWNAAGGIKFSAYMDLYARMFEMCSKIIRGVYSNARLYVPLDHFWNIIYSNDFKAKKCLDTFGARMKKDGYPWNLAYHAYNGDLKQPSITAKQYFGTTDKPTSPIITMKNLSVLTKYVREKYGKKTRIILSEHGYSSTWKKKDVSEQQSEAIALSYYLAMADPMVDSFIYYSQVDQNMLTKVGASFGLWKVSKSENATNKKPSWTAFKYMDTDRKDPVLNKARKTSEKMTGKKVTATCSYRKGKAASCKKYSLKKRLATGWKKTGAVRSFYRRGASYTLRRSYSRNKNVYWGIRQRFRKLNVSKYPRLCLTVRGGRLTTKKTQLLIRVFSGKKHLFEASCVIRSGKTQRFKIDLKKWKYKNKITKIQILVKRKSGNWYSQAGVVIEDIGFR